LSFSIERNTFTLETLSYIGNPTLESSVELDAVRHRENAAKGVMPGHTIVELDELS